VAWVVGGGVAGVVVAGGGAGAVTVCSIVVPGCVTVLKMVTGLRRAVAEWGALLRVAATAAAIPPPIRNANSSGTSHRRGLGARPGDACGRAA
jgi:hypothetical protein